MDKLWASHQDAMLMTTLMSGLRVFSKHWQWTGDWQEANLWAVDVETDDIKVLEQRYHECGEPKPKVIYLAENFMPMPVSRWTYFKSPLNIRVLHKWMLSQGFETTRKNYHADVLEKDTDAKWRTHRFQLMYWPNITQYAEGADIMMVCSVMMHDWCDYNQLIPFNVDDEILAKLLNDAETEGNLIYYSNDELSDEEIKPIEAEKDEVKEEVKQESENLGLLKKLFNRFR